MTRREKFFDPLLSFYLEKLLKETNTKAKLNYPVAMNFSCWILLLTLVLHGKLGQSFCLFPSKIGLWHEMPLTCLLSDIVESLLKVAFLALIGSGQKLILQQFRFFYRVLFYLFIKIHQPVPQFHVFLKNTYDYL